MGRDHRLSSFVDGEIETQLRVLDYLRASLARKIEGLTEEEARRRLVPSGTTLLWLGKHVAAAEALWLDHYLTGEVDAEDLPDEDELDHETVETVTALLAARGARTREIVRADPDPGRMSALVARHHDRVSLRWVLTHLVEEVARHAGHADILREQIDGTTGR
jgi:uncharacterized damage-inducible protein DinB